MTRRLLLLGGVVILAAVCLAIASGATTPSSESSVATSTEPPVSAVDDVVLSPDAGVEGDLEVGFPRTDVGAVEMVVELNRAQVGLDVEAALAVVRTYAAPDDARFFDDLATSSVARRRAEVGVPPSGDVEAPAGYAQVPVGFQADDLGADRYLVSVLNDVVTTTSDGQVVRSMYVGQQVAQWFDADPAHSGGWRIVEPSAADREQFTALPVPTMAQPGTDAFVVAGWSPLPDSAPTIGR